MIKIKYFYFGIILFTSLISCKISAQTYYINVSKGDDLNPGTSILPFKSFKPVVKLVNEFEGEGPTTIKLSPGIYNLNEKVLFKNSRNYTEEHRLIIEASILPGDTSWTNVKMPVIISAAYPSKNFEFDCSVGIDIEVSHATIRGLKFLGNPLPGIYYYPIGRQGKELEDLVITQCMFIGDEDSLPIQSGILAHGNKIIVDHSIFYNCKNSVVFYFADDNREIQRHGSEMKYCIVDGAYESAVWTASPDINFKFHHNIITRSRYVWIHNLLNTSVYSIENCIITNNQHYITKLNENYEYVESNIIYIENDVIKSGAITIIKKDDVQIPKDYLHIKPNTLGSELGAGLFIK